METSRPEAATTGPRIIPARKPIVQIGEQISLAELLGRIPKADANFLADIDDAQRPCWCEGDACEHS